VLTETAVPRAPGETPFAVEVAFHPPDASPVYKEAVGAEEFVNFVGPIKVSVKVT